MKDYQSLTEQINNIENTLKASGRYVFNSKKLIVAGVMFLLIPIIQYLINISFWKNSFINNHIEIGIFINIVFYIVFFKLVFRITRSSKKYRYHPSINSYVKKAIDLHDVILKTMFTTIIVLPICGYGNLAFPFVYILLGLIYNLFGRFSLDIIRKISISYILIGIISIFFVKNYSNIYWQFMLIYLGITYIFMGKILEKNR
ncbi:hypothetical protein [Francisella tularensis]|uniref:hypothetical protein n=1 Tax=Francisella tularensis TaxID=263 RepID=UPI000173E5B4|nr:hypothetical protein [Francisella tularensis]ACD30896.1 hypothetical membrane protein [Francisella tularensis subsp. mediasiatica FSC147]MBK2077833.1 hypothetical protein [Francisella tularensis subsp. mediasiatica]MBK2101976.1 hypothetical protein [Francisella tularensis subsp. mediasiatica]MBK2103954.1 hypothetical protein [Francisella tularensis subsp. mediasiatica]MDN9003316.1 hypothetical protein [Francisella tularensis subsp. mediasiatica]